MTTLELKVDLPDSLANEAKAAGLLTPEGIERLLRDAIRRKAFDDFLTVADRVEAANIPPMTMESTRRWTRFARSVAPSAMRLVLDTNVVVAALLWSGSPNRLIELAAGEVSSLLKKSKIPVRVERSGAESKHECLIIQWLVHASTPCLRHYAQRERSFSTDC